VRNFDTWLRQSLLLGLVLLVLVVFGGAGPAHAVFGEDQYVRSKFEQKMARLVGRGYGCAAVDGRSFEVRVTTRHALGIARSLRKRGTRFYGRTITRVRLIEESQSLDNYLNVWLDAAQTRPNFDPNSEATTAVRSPRVPNARNKCRAIQVYVVSWPGHPATEGELNWAHDVERRYPENVEALIYFNEIGPVFSTK